MMGISLKIIKDEQGNIVDIVLNPKNKEQEQ